MNTTGKWTLMLGRVVFMANTTAHECTITRETSKERLKCASYEKEQPMTNLLITMYILECEVNFKPR